MAYLVDGFNLIHAVESLEALLRAEGPPAACRALAALLGRWSALDPQRQAVVLVLDGGPGSLDPIPRAPGLTVRFRGHADQLLLELMETAREGHVLVSRDRELTEAAARGGWHGQEDPRRFWARVRDDLAAVSEELEKLRTPDPLEVQAWRSLFEAEGFTPAPAVPPPPAPAAPPPAAPAPAAPPPASPSPSRPASNAPPPARPTPGRARRASGRPGWAPRAAPSDRERERRVGPEELQEWLDLFREPPG